MSTAVLEKVSEPTRLRVVKPESSRATVTPATQAFLDIHSLFPVLVAGVVSFTLAALFVGSVLCWIALRYSGIMAP